MCADICNIGQKLKKLLNDVSFYPGLPFSDHFDKGTPYGFFAKMFILVMVPRNIIMSGV